MDTLSLPIFKCTFSNGGEGSSYSHLCNKAPQNKLNSSGIYRLKCKTCTVSYVGQTYRSLGIQHQDHTRYIETNYQIFGI